MSDGKTFLAQSFAALEQLNQQHLDPQRPSIPPATQPAPAWDTAKWLAYMASPAGKALMEQLRSPDVAWRPLLVVDGQESPKVAEAFKAISSPPAAPKPKGQQGAASKAAPVAAKRPRRPALPEVAQIETEQVRYVYTVETTRTRRQADAPSPAQPIPLFVQFNPSLGAQPKPPAGFAPGQNLAIGAGMGAVTGAGVAYMLNAARHFAPDPLSQALFAVAGAAAGFGIGGLLGAKIVKADEVTGPLLKLATGKA